MDELQPNRPGLASGTDGSASSTATWISLSLSASSWNMQAHRTLDEFGATALGKPQVSSTSDLIPTSPGEFCAAII